jgi:hypothetical protein
MKKDAELLQLHTRCETLDVRLKLAGNAANSPLPKDVLHDKDVRIEALID